MRIEHPKPTVLRVTFHAFELSALVAAARWVVEGAEGELPEEAREQIKQVLENYDREMRRSAESPRPRRSPSENGQ